MLVDKSMICCCEKHPGVVLWGSELRGLQVFEVCGGEIISCFLPQRVAACGDVILCGDLGVCKCHPSFPGYYSCGEIVCTPIKGQVLPSKFSIQYPHALRRIKISNRLMEAKLTFCSCVICCLSNAGPS